MLKYFLLISLLVSATFAANSAQLGIVSIDGAMVYKDSNFDAPVIAYLKKGKKVRVSSRRYGAFYRVLVKRGVVGYISDIDVKVVGGDRSVKKKRKKRRKKSRRKKRKRSEEFGEDSSDEDWAGSSDKRFRKPKKSIFAKRYVGAFLGVVNFKEEVLGQKVSSNVNVIGAKVTGPELLFEGPYIFDINLMMSLSAPSYYGEISSTAVSGFFAILDAQVLYPYSTPTYEKWTIYFGGGPFLIYSKFGNVTVDGEDQPLDLQDLKLGVSALAGFSYEIGKDYLAKIEPKFFLEKNSYFGIFASIQKEF